MRYLLQLSYHGKAYHGWQKQHNATSVQQVVEEKLSLLIGENIEVLGCGRTDTGVHAKQYFAHFDSTKSIDTNRILYRLQQLFPTDIAAHQLTPVSDAFNARFDAKLRTYEYWITQQRNPFLTELACYQYGPFDVEAMNNCAQLLLGEHDFECFSKVHTQVNHFMCTVTEAYWAQKDEKLVFTISANRFLRNMVRAVVGTLIEVGRGKITEADFRLILESKNRSEAGQSVPAHGLYLTQVIY